MWEYIKSAEAIRHSLDEPIVLQTSYSFSFWDLDAQTLRIPQPLPPGDCFDGIHELRTISAISWDGGITYETICLGKDHDLKTVKDFKTMLENKRVNAGIEKCLIRFNAPESDFLSVWEYYLDSREEIVLKNYTAASRICHIGIAVSVLDVDGKSKGDLVTIDAFLDADGKEITHADGRQIAHGDADTDLQVKFYRTKGGQVLERRQFVRTNIIFCHLIHQVCIHKCFN